MTNSLKNIAFIFPGQGSQSVGMGKTLAETYPEARQAFEEANDVLGYDLEALCFAGPVEKLNMTEFTQPALVATSVAAMRVLDKEFGLGKDAPSFVAGHSLGEYSALVSAGTMKYADALRIVSLRGKYMQEACGEGEGAMSAIIGLENDIIKEICTQASVGEEVVVPANLNSPGQLVISGSAKAVERANKAAKEAGAKRAILLPVSVPSHSPLMKPAAEKLAEELQKITLKKPIVPLVSNVLAEPTEDVSLISDLLKRQLTSPVRWSEIIQCLKRNGVTVTLEIGSGKILAGLVKRIDRDIHTCSFGAPENITCVEKTINELT
ncbi:MAG: ACP S-malonyltransferase [Deltaproteobacteria bacterium]|nr:ACP S-malonyltransferase [Deltaproteobacteria bacterium]